MIPASPLARVYVRYSLFVFRRARTLLADDEMAKEVAQEVFLRAVKAASLDANTINPMAWFLRATTNLCLNRLRDASCRERIFGKADARWVVRHILEQVPEDLQEAAIYCYVDELSHEEVADLVGVPRRMIGNRLATFHSLMDEMLASTRSGVRSERP
jgi:DNA-directed RNA polymerase specialized sigma24 family protein